MKKLFILILILVSLKGYSKENSRDTVPNTIWNHQRYIPGNLRGTYTIFDVSSTQTRKVLFDDIESQMVSDSLFSSYQYVKKQRDSIFSVLNASIALKVNISDTLNMLLPYHRKADTVTLSNRINGKQSNLKIINVEDYGAVHDGTTADNAAIQAAIDYANSIGGAVVYLPSGNYNTNGIINLKSNVRIVGSGNATTIYQSTSSIFGNAFTLGTTYALSANANTTDTTITLASSPAISAGDWIIIRDESVWRSNPDGNKSGQIVQVQSVVGNVLYITPSFQQSYTTANSATVQKITPCSNASISNLKLVNTAPGTKTSALTFFQYCYHLTLDGLDVSGGDGPGLFLTYAWESTVKNCNVYDLTDDAANNRFGYGVNVGFACHNVLVDGCHFKNCRHGFTTTGSGSGYGIPRNITIANSDASFCSLAAFDTHVEGENILFSNDRVYGGKTFYQSYGYQNRCYSTQYLNCEVYGTTGAGFAFFHNSFAKYVSYIGCKATGVRKGAGFYLDETATLSACTSMENDYQGIYISGNATMGPFVLTNVKVQDNNKSGGSYSGVQIDNNTQGITFNSLSAINSSGNTQQYGIYSTGTTTSVNIYNSVFSGNVVASVSLVGATVALDNTVPSGDNSLNGAFGSSSSLMAAFTQLSSTTARINAATDKIATIQQTQNSNNTAITGYITGTVIDATSSAYTIPNSIAMAVFNPSATVASKTITLPSAPYDGQRVDLVFGKTVSSGTVITTLTIAANTGQSLVQSAAPTTATYGQLISYRYNGTLATWYRLN